jgi:hypothetical protein
MMMQTLTLNRRGISLVEILIGIMVLGIGVISLATIFPIGLLKMRRSVNEVRGTVVARSALSETRVRNLLAPPIGPDARFFTGYPLPWTQPKAGTYSVSAFRPLVGEGLPVIIDPLWMISNASDLGNVPLANVPPRAEIDRFGLVDFATAGTPDFAYGQGLLRARGGPTGGTFPLELASLIFSSPDDLAYGDNEGRVLPLQSATAAGPPYLSPTNGTPFAPGTLGLSRERRYTWMIVARKVSARQVFDPGVDGVIGDAVPLPSLSTAGSDDLAENYGPDPGADLIRGTADDPAKPGRNMLTGLPEAAPVGPFDVTIIVFYTRDFGTRESVYANPTANPALIFTKNSDIATLVQRPNVPFPNIPLNSYVMDTTFGPLPTAPVGTPDTWLRGGHVYRVISRTTDSNGNMILTLDQRARSDGYVLTVLKGAVGVYEKQVP